MKIYQARYVLPMSAPPFENGAVVVRDGVIIATGSHAALKRHFPSAKTCDLGDVILMPGLINAHCHFDYTMMRHQLQSQSSFTSWIQGLNKIKFSLQEDEVALAIVEGWKELHSWGCTSAVNIVSFPKLLPRIFHPSLLQKQGTQLDAALVPAFAGKSSSMHDACCSTLYSKPALPHEPSQLLRHESDEISGLERLLVSPLRLWQLLEVMDIRGPQQGEEGLQMAEVFFKKSQEEDGHRKIKFGISPHAPQTTSQGCYRGATQLAQQYHVPFCTHLAESEEEFEMFTQGSGPLFDFLKSFGRDMSDTGFQTPVQALLKKDLLPRGALLVHMNCLTSKDRESLAKHGNDFFIVHCPKTHRFFERAPFDWKFFYDHGYQLLLGTDSLASNDELNLFSEMQLFAKIARDLTPEEILKMVTLHPAEALGMKERLGELSVGAFADMIAISFSGKKKEIAEAVIQNKTFPRRIF